MESFPMTQKGYEKLKAKLDYLKKVRRPEIIKAIEEARAHGDLSENAEYEAAKHEQGLIEARIRELEYKLAHAEVIDPSTIESDEVMFGATVTIRDAETGRVKTYKIVGSDEADPQDGTISINSPLARGLIGFKAGDSVLIGDDDPREFEILEVKYI
ncbi:MAG TPA: transcription elongation factor GreA [Proteobacteria bacterium]|nr:transcription elongation factor GreA [Pseudomonadota bacterium]